MKRPARSNIAQRLDRLPFSAWHWRVLVALGAAWVLDGLEVTLAGSLGAVLERGDTLHLSASEVGMAGSAYLAGAVLGALVFGRLADRLGRQRLFLVTLAVYGVATLLTALSPDYPWFALCRFATGLGIGGEYAAINSAIDELMPARVRGRTNLAVNGSFWLGAALGAGLSLVLLDPAVFGPAVGWRMCFLVGGLLAACILLVRRGLPESPRWLLTHGRANEAERVVATIEEELRSRGLRLAAPSPATPSPSTRQGTAPGSSGALRRTNRTLVQPAHAGAPTLPEVLRALAGEYRQRSLVALALMLAQAFFYNAIFFTYALMLVRFYGVASERVGVYLFPFALGNILGPLVLGPLFDSIGRRRMIAATYVLSGLGLAASAWAFEHGWLDAFTQALCWSGIFFVASAAASSAYLTVSEVFPLEMRALAIAVFYAIGTGAGGVAAPALLGMLISSGSRAEVAAGYLLAAALMVAAGVIALFFGVDAEGRSLEEVARPMGWREAEP